MMNVITVVHMAAKVGMAAEPWASTDEDTSRKPFRTVVTVRSAGIGSVIVIPVRAFGSDTDTHDDLRIYFGSGRREAGSNYSSQSKIFKTVHEFTSRLGGRE
jgi:hypothetical protein